MFNPSRADVRRFFFETWGKYRAQRDRAAPDEAAYLECIRRRLG